MRSLAGRATGTAAGSLSIFACIPMGSQSSSSKTPRQGHGSTSGEAEARGASVLCRNPGWAGFSGNRLTRKPRYTGLSGNGFTRKPTHVGFGGNRFPRKPTHVGFAENDLPRKPTHVGFAGSELTRIRGPEQTVTRPWDCRGASSQRIPRAWDSHRTGSLVMRGSKLRPKTSFLAVFAVIWSTHGPRSVCDGRVAACSSDLALTHARLSGSERPDSSRSARRSACRPVDTTRHRSSGESQPTPMV